MAPYNWFLFHHDDGHHGSRVCSGSHGSRVCDSQCVTPRSYMTKYVAFAMTRSPQLYLTRSSDEMIGSQSLDSVPNVPGMM